MKRSDDIEVGQLRADRGRKPGSLYFVTHVEDHRIHGVQLHPEFGTHEARSAHPSSVRDMWPWVMVSPPSENEGTPQ